jgi:Flp pilus assembly pilin Flp
MNRKFWRDERGATSLYGLAIACAIIISVAVVVSGMLTYSARAASQVAMNRGDASTLEAYATSMKDVTADGLAVAIPTTDVTGAANADGHAFLVYSRDGKNNPHFTEWVCSGACTPGAAGGTLTAYSFTTFSNPAATLKTISTPQTGVTMQATYLLASQLANPAVSDHAAFFQAAGVTNVPDRLVQLGYPGVEGGNRITVVKIASKSNAYDLHLLPLAAPTTGQTVVVGYLKAVPNPLALSPIAAFAVSVSPAETATATETNYPTTSHYTESDTCAGIATITPNGGVADGPSAPYTVTPVVTDYNGGTCVMTVRDIDGQTASTGISVGATTHALVITPQQSFTVGQNTLVSFVATDQTNGALSQVYIASTALGPPGSSCSGYGPGGNQASGSTFSLTVVAGTCYVTIAEAFNPTITQTVTVTATQNVQMVCNTDPLAGTSTITTIYEGTTAVPPCAAPTPPPTPTPTAPPTETPTCPPGYSGTYPYCTINPPTTTPTPSVPEDITCSTDPRLGSANSSGAIYTSDGQPCVLHYQNTMTVYPPSDPVHCPTDVSWYLSNTPGYIATGPLYTPPPGYTDSAVIGYGITYTIECNTLWLLTGTDYSSPYTPIAYFPMDVPMPAGWDTTYRTEAAACKATPNAGNCGPIGPLILTLKNYLAAHGWTVDTP